jgi:hypothetical protein
MFESPLGTPDQTPLTIESFAFEGRDDRHSTFLAVSLRGKQIVSTVRHFGGKE